MAANNTLTSVSEKLCCCPTPSDVSLELRWLNHLQDPQVLANPLQDAAIHFIQLVTKLNCIDFPRRAMDLIAQGTIEVGGEVRNFVQARGVCCGVVFRHAILDHILQYLGLRSCNKALKKFPIICNRQKYRGTCHRPQLLAHCASHEFLSRIRVLIVNRFQVPFVHSPR